ncbi:hypothetical protein KI387_035577, partial [Taxus chinensis]
VDFCNSICHLSGNNYLILRCFWRKVYFEWYLKRTSVFWNKYNDSRLWRKSISPGNCNQRFATYSASCMITVRTPIPTPSMSNIGSGKSMTTTTGCDISILSNPALATMVPNPAGMQCRLPAGSGS